MSKLSFLIRKLLRLQPISEPADVERGDLWLDSATDTLKIRGTSATATILDSNSGAANLPYDNATSGLTATNVQTAIDEVDADLDTAQSAISTLQSDLNTAESDISTINSTLTNKMDNNGLLKTAVASNASTTGADQLLAAPTAGIERYTNASLTSIKGITAPTVNQFWIWTNATGNVVTVRNQSGSEATAANRIITGTGTDLRVADGASLWLYYDLTTARTRVVGGSGGGSRTVTGSYASPTSVTTSGITALAGSDEDNYIASNSGRVDVTTNPQISAGTVDGQTLRLIGTSDTNYILLEDGNGLALNGSWESYAGTSLILRWDNGTSLWRQIGREE